MRTQLQCFAVSVVAVGVLSACALVRQQETVGEYIDDVTISASVRAAFLADKDVDVVAIRVETLRSVVVLSGFARSERERERAEVLAWRRGVTSVRNDIVVRP